MKNAPTPEQANDAFEKALAAFEKRIGVTFTDRSLLQQAFTHKSVWDPNCIERGQEALARIGDKFMEEYVLARLREMYPTLPSKRRKGYARMLVSNAHWDGVGYRMQMHECLRIAKRRAAVQPVSERTVRLLADTFESFVGALVIEKGDKVFPIMDTIFDTYILTEPIRDGLKAGIAAPPYIPNPSLQQTRDIVGPTGNYPLARLYQGRDSEKDRSIAFRRELKKEDGMWTIVAPQEYNSNAPLIKELRKKILAAYGPPPSFELKKRIEPYPIYAHHGLSSYAIIIKNNILLSIGKDANEALTNAVEHGHFSEMNDDFRIFHEHYFKYPERPADDTKTPE